MSQARREVPAEGAFGASIESQGKRKCWERSFDTVTLCEPEPDTPPTPYPQTARTAPAHPGRGPSRPAHRCRLPEGGRTGAVGRGGAGRGALSRAPASLPSGPCPSIVHLHPDPKPISPHSVGEGFEKGLWKSTGAPWGVLWSGRRGQLEVLQE